MSLNDTWIANEVNSAKTIARLSLPRYGFDHNTELSLISTSENAIFQVKPSGGQAAAILRVHRRRYHTEASIRSELSWMQALRFDAGLSVPKVVPATDGSLVVTVVEPERMERWLVVLFEYMPGTHPRPDQVSGLAEAIGAITATLHLHASRWPRESWFERPVWNCDEILGRSARFGSWQRNNVITHTQFTTLEKLDIYIRNSLDEYGKGSNRYGLIHADIRLENLLIDGKDIHIIDFDDCGDGWYMYDPSAFLALSGPAAQEERLISAWLSGYTQVRRLSSMDEENIALFTLLRRLLLIGWAATHTSATLSDSLQESFVEDTCLAAQKYLRKA
ncbi:phosphotransferase enzyme family protein [Micromonospora aurantiaca (nom. illeg.)]|nr:phosphotransferase [Micromonospora aurantiaca]